jgi:hypothetical protein
MEERGSETEARPAEPEMRGPDPNLYVADPLHERKGRWEYLRHARAGWAVLALCILTLAAWWIWNAVA